VEFSATCQCSICCLKMIVWRIISGRGSALETRTTTRGKTSHVQQLRPKVPGGTATVTTPTWTVSTTTAATTHRITMTVWCGVSGRAGGTRWDSPRWSSDRLMCELNDDMFCPLFSLINYYSSCIMHGNQSQYINIFILDYVRYFNCTLFNV